MTVIRQEDFIASVAGALQYISYYHPVDYITSLTKAYEREQSHAAKDAIAQILINSRMCAEGHRPICQDTGIVNVFVKVGMDVRFEGPNGGPPTLDIQEMCDEGVRRAYLDPDNKLRASLQADPAGARKNTKDNTPSVVNVELVRGSTVEITVAAKGGGSEAKVKIRHARSFRLRRRMGAQNRSHHGRRMVPSRHARHRHRRHRGKSHAPRQASTDGSHRHPGPHRPRPQNHRRKTPRRAIRQGQSPRHRRTGPRRPHHRTRRQSARHTRARRQSPRRHDSQLRRHTPRPRRPRRLRPCLPRPAILEDWPKLVYDVSYARHVNLDTVTREEAATWKPGEVLLLTGKLLTGRDAAHKRMTDMLSRGEKLPVDFKDRFIYYVGPVDPVREEVIGPAGPTTATRMDKFTRQMLAETGLLGMIGKAERGPVAIDAIKEFGAVYLMAVGGAAYLVSKAIIGSRQLAFEDLGMEGIYEFEVKDMPVTVAVDSKGTSVHQTGPAEWQQRIAGIPILQ